MTAALPMGSQKITGMADPTVATDGATKNYVDTTTGAFFSTGDIKPTLKTAADAGWVMGGANSTIGNVGSGAVLASTTALALYTLIWNNISSPTANAFCAVTGGLGASAAADWAGLKSLQTGWYASHALGIAGSGGSLTTRVLGSDTRNETSTLVAANLPPVTSTNPSQNISVRSTGLHVGQGTMTSWSNGTGVTLAAFVAGAIDGQLTSTDANSISVTSTGTTSTPVSIIQPTVWVNVMIKL